MTKQEKRNNIISGIVTVIVFIFLLIVVLFVSLKSQDPPPAPKKVLLIELSSGGGGGGHTTPTKQTPTPAPSENVATQNAAEAPVVNANESNVQEKAQPVDNTPKPDPNASYRPGKGSGRGGGDGTGSGSGKGSGIGPGEGSGSGGGIGYGHGSRGYVSIPDLTINERGQVAVEVHVTADGRVVAARILPEKTTITNTKIQNNCLQRARETKYKSGNEELRLIVFKP